VWAIILSVEGVLVLLTAYKLYSYSKYGNRTITVLARDSIGYFLIILVSLVLLVLHDRFSSFTSNFVVPCQCTVSIAVGRMMTNLRTSTG